MKWFSFIFIVLLSLNFCKGQSSPSFTPPPGIALNQDWKWHAGDDPAWALPGFDDNRWENIDPAKDIMDLPQLWKSRVGWLRLRFTVDSTLTGKSLALLVEQTGASEIFLNGQLLGRFGEIKNKSGQVRAAAPSIGTFLGFPLRTSGEQVLAVRFALQTDVPYIEFVGQPNKALSLLVTEAENINFFRKNDVRAPLDYFKFGFLMLLAILHGSLFRFGTSPKSNLHFFLCIFSYAINSILLAIVYYYVEAASVKTWMLIAASVLYVTGCIFFLTAIYTIFNYKRGAIYWILLTYLALSIPLLFIHYHNSYNLGINLVALLAFLEVIRITFISAKRKQRGAGIIVWGCVCFIIGYILWAVYLFKILPGGPAWMYGHLAFNIGYLSIPVSISLYLALEASFHSRALNQKLAEVQQLSIEKQQILATQNETLEKQVNERTTELNQSLLQLKATQNQLIQKEKLASLGELTAGIAHEIQNPLNFVNNFAEVSIELSEELEQSVETGNRQLIKSLSLDLRENMQQIAQNGQRASTIVQAMLEHSQTSTGERRKIDINALAEEYFKLAYHGFRAKHNDFIAKLETDFDMGLPMLDIVVQDIGRVLLNLYNNALYALWQRQSQEGINGYEPTLRISTRAAKEQVEVQIQDNGTGIPVSIQEKIFQPFFTTKPTGQGTGLGLSLSYDIITKGHGGQLRLESRERQGTAFYLSLPIN